jgi:pyruvate/2-oxoglutarate dehydrogenase complex dihydrolipoamide acyltransferase (E2) component
MGENNKEETEVEKSRFREEIDDNIRHIESQADIVPLVMGLVSTKLIQESRHVNKYIKTGNKLTKLPFFNFFTTLKKSIVSNKYQFMP